ncbi:hypothetical protein FGO68_gene13878 [Halteria grandinella]|uniref:Uncharacterized protein n=1 Tax=Halteria grandinella TaxID=5974 RepID=A0A8J8NIV1_HALGN|nr:hypothetical protein FGO68_gene13878 [Halteria grandinella]
MSGLSCDQIWTIKGRSIRNFIINQFLLRPSRTFSPPSSLTLPLASLTHLSSYPPPPPTPLITLVHAIRATQLNNGTSLQTQTRQAHNPSIIGETKCQKKRCLQQQRESSQMCY